MSRRDRDSKPGKLKNREYTKQPRKLQMGLRVIVVFEGHDGAGKGGTIRASAERVGPRVFRAIALPAPSDREKSQMYIQRHIVRPDDKRGAKLDRLSRILKHIPHEKSPRSRISAARLAAPEISFLRVRSAGIEVAPFKPRADT